MSKSIKTLFAVSMLALVAACGGAAPNSGDVEEFIVIDPVPVTIEPTFSGKYS